MPVRRHGHVKEASHVRQRQRTERARQQRPRTSRGDSLTPDEVAVAWVSTRQRGLSAAEAELRLGQVGPNAIAEEEPEPVWKQFFKHYRDYMQIVLVVAAVVSLLIGEWGTAIGLAVLTLFNAWLGYHQEGKAQAAAAALGAMMKAVAKVRRDGRGRRGPRRRRSCPGDIVLVDAGDRVPADGRVVVAATLQVEEGALTGESVAVEKRHEPHRRGRTWRSATASAWRS